MIYQYLCLYLAVANLAAFAFCGWDKLSARRGWRRVPERRLLALCALGGSPAFLVGMALFRHKTRKRKFALGVPLILAGQIALAVIAAYLFCA